MCELCDDEGPCARVQLATFDPETKTWRTRMSNLVCPRCTELLGPVIAAAAKSWCAKKSKRVAKVTGVKVED